MNPFRNRKSGLGTLHLQQARLPSTLPSNWHAIRLYFSDHITPYVAVAFYFGQYQKLLRYGKLAPVTYDHGLGLRVDAETSCTMKRLLQGRPPARRAGELVGAGLLMQKSTVLMEAVMTGLPAGGDLFQQRHIKHGFLLLLPLKPPTRHRVCAPHRPSRIGTKGGNGHTWPTAF